MYRFAVGRDAGALFLAAMELPEDERASLAVRLLGTVDEPAVDDTSDGYEAWCREIERRLEALVSGDDPGEGWDEVRKDVAAEFGEG